MGVSPEYSNLKFQNQHGGLEWDAVRLSNSRQKNLRLRRSQDARLFRAMSGSQIEAFQLLGFGYKLLQNGLGAKISSYTDSRGKALESDTAGAMIADYITWGRKCVAKRLNHAAASDIIGLGMTMNAVDKERRFYKGKAQRNLLACLDVYLEMRGWS